MAAYTHTHCPYCTPPYEGKYAWRRIVVNNASDIAGSENLLEAIEIYCTKCLSTVAITPLAEIQPNAV